MKDLILGAPIERRIHLIRGHKVMLSSDLAALYGVQARALIQAVKRNRKRFPQDFMFKLTLQEARASRSQIVILNEGRPEGFDLMRGGNIKYSPYAFTEQGVAMLSSVLKSRHAVRVNIAIMRAFVKLRDMISAHKELAAKLAELERAVAGRDKHIQSLFGVPNFQSQLVWDVPNLRILDVRDAIRRLTDPVLTPKPPIGFRTDQRAP